MPLRNLSPDPEEDYFSDGLTEDIITDLSKISGLFVIARNSVMAYKGQNVLPLQVAGELGVRHILEGSVRRAGPRVRISTQLVDAPLSRNVWAERFDGRMEDIFDLQDQVARKIVEALKVKLTKGEEERLARQTTVNPEAYDLVHKANKLGLISSYESHLEARELYERALALDPDYARAYVGLGWTYFDEWPFGWSESPEVLDKALELGRKSLALDDAQTEAHQLISCVYLWQLKHDQAEKAIREVLALAPGNAEALSFLGYILTFAGRPAEALEPLQAAIRLNPKVPVRYRFYLGLALLALDRHEEATAELERCLAENRAYVPAWATLARAYVVTGRMERAGEAYRAIRKVVSDYSVERFGPKLPYKDPAAKERVLAELRMAEKS
jgi:adenylate cyclase